MEEASPPAESPHMENIQRQIEELSDLMKSYKGNGGEASYADMEKLVKQYAMDLEVKIKQVLEQSAVAASLGHEDSSALFGQLKKDLIALEKEKMKVYDEIEILQTSVMADSETLERDLEWLKWSLDHTKLLDLQKMESSKCLDCFYDNQLGSTKIDAFQKFQVLDLQAQIEKKNSILKSLQSFDYEFKRYVIVEEIEDALSCMKVLEFDQNSIRFSLRTYIPKFEDRQQKVEIACGTSQVDHELIIEVVDEKLQLQSAEIFPNDVYIVDIVEAAKGFREFLSQTMVPQTSLEWFIQKVQERIIISTLRRSAAKNANGFRYSAEYVERDGIIIAHFTEGIDAILKASHGWPLCDSPLELMTLKYSGNGVKTIPLSILRKVEDAAKSLDTDGRKNLSSFLNAIEALLYEQ
ncbi:hypothetical protein SAY87_029936 [Trapa incisa]|uniref:Uncharacterized protein n=1 Tax=Trapa incisa TaxID=236973 RepID=A0AAN7KDZ8_9MYRT|nr:hypothetical protein SAY87_029936 [Trapa incisa]